MKVPAIIKKASKFITFFGILFLLLEHFMDGLLVMVFMLFYGTELFDSTLLSITYIGTTIIRFVAIYFAINIFSGRSFFINMFSILEIAGYLIIASSFLYSLSIGGASLEQEFLFGTQLKEALESSIILFFFIMVLPAIWVQLPFVKNSIIRRYDPYDYIGV